jgi:hypothetical protein
VHQLKVATATVSRFCHDAFTMPAGHDEPVCRDSRCDEEARCVHSDVQSSFATPGLPSLLDHQRAIDEARRWASGVDVVESTLANLRLTDTSPEFARLTEPLDIANSHAKLYEAARASRL